jgi:hypothetical protein
MLCPYQFGATNPGHFPRDLSPPQLLQIQKSPKAHNLPITTAEFSQIQVDSGKFNQIEK